MALEVIDKMIIGHLTFNNENFSQLKKFEQEELIAEIFKFLITEDSAWAIELLVLDMCDQEKFIQAFINEFSKKERSELFQLIYESSVANLKEIINKKFEDSHLIYEANENKKLDTQEYDSCLVE